jgi:hypothetical protein
LFDLSDVWRLILLACEVLGRVMVHNGGMGKIIIAIVVIVVIVAVLWWFLSRRRT